MLIGILRPVWLFHDPYNDEKSWPRVAAYLLVDTGLPAITTAFAVLFLALLRYVCTTQLPNFIMISLRRDSGPYGLLLARSSYLGKDPFSYSHYFLVNKACA